MFEKEGRGVFLPYAEFLKLWQKSRPTTPPKEKPKPPFEAAISAGSYEGTVDGTAATITATYNVEMLKEEGWAALPLPLSGVAVTESAIEGGKAILNVTDRGYVMLMEKPGMYKLTMKFVVKVDRQPGQNSFSFNCPRAAVSRLNMVLPGTDLAVKVEPLLVASTNDGPNGNTVVQAFLGSTNRLSFEWRPKTVEKGSADSLRFAKTFIKASAQEGTLRAEAAIAYEILRTPADSFRVSVPKGVNVITVDGANIKDWTTTAEEQWQMINVSLHTPEKKSYALKIVVEQPVAEFPAELTFPEIIPLDAARETGSLVISGSEYLDVKVKSRSGLSQIAVEDLPKDMQLPRAFFAGTYVSHPFSLTLSATRIDPKVTATVSSVVTILKENLLLKSSIQYHIRKAGIFKVGFKVPASLDLRDVGNDQTVDDYSVEVENGVKTVTVVLANRAFGVFTLPVLCEELREEETGQLSLPVLEAVDVSRQTGVIAVAVHETLEAKVENSENATPLGIQELQNARLRPDGNSGARTVFGFHYIKQPVSVSLTVEKRKPHVTARVDTLVQIAEDAVKLKTWLVYAINYAGIRELSFSVPAGLGDELRISGANIKEKVRTAVEGEEDTPKRDQWRVSLQSETLGEYQLLLEYETKLEGIRKESGAEFEVPEIIVHEVARENGFFAVTKGPNVEVEDESKGLDPIDSRELPDSRLATSGTFLSFKYLYHPYTLKLKATLHDYVSVLQSLVNEAYLESVISKDGVIMTEARYLVQTNQLQLLPLTLPANSEVRSLFVNGQAERPRKGEGGELLVPMAKVAPGQSFVVSIIYESREDGGEMGWLGSLNTSAPRFPAEIPVLRLVWEVYTPRDYQYLWLGGNMQTKEVDRRGWRRLERLLERYTPRLANRVKADSRRSTPASTLQNQQSGAAGAIAVNFPREGVKHQFTRLSGDGDASLTYIDSDLDSAVRVLFLLATILLGLYRAQGISRCRKVIGLAAGAIVLASFVPAGIAVWLDSVFWGAVALAVYWGVPPAFAQQKEAWRKRRDKKKNKASDDAKNAPNADSWSGEESDVPGKEQAPESPVEDAPASDEAVDEAADDGKEKGNDEGDGGRKDE